MKYGDIATILRNYSDSLSRLADELERIQMATHSINLDTEATPQRMSLSVKETAELLGVSTNTVYQYQLIRRDDFPSLRVGKRVVVNRKELQNWLDKQSEEWLGY